MGNNPSLMLQAEDIEEIEKETGCEYNFFEELGLKKNKISF